MTDLPSRRPIANFWDFAVRAWRPAASWVCVLVLIINGAVLPLAQIWGISVQPLNWTDLSVFVAALLAAGAARTAEKLKGVTS